MQTLRNSPIIARLVLGWFVLFVGAAAASPLVRPVSLQLVCSSAGQVRVVADDDGGAVSGDHVLDCPACLPGMAPVPSVWRPSLPPPVSALVLAPGLDAPHGMSGVAAAPLPARGPPVRA